MDGSIGGGGDDPPVTPKVATLANLRSVFADVRPGATLGLGSLPHFSAKQAAVFALGAHDIPSIPSLPRRSPAESLLAQALLGVRGVTLGQYGTVAVDVNRLDPEAPVDTDLRRDNFYGFRRFLEHASSISLTGPVTWPFIGPISVGLALRRAGAHPDVAFRVALVAVQSHLRALAAAVDEALPDSPQLVMLDEPFGDDLMARDFPLAPEEAVDLMSAAMASVESLATVGVHCCGDADVASLLEAGPGVLSLAVSDSLIPLAGYLDRFLRNGGWIAWGAVATEGPVGLTSARSWQQLDDMWRALADRGADPYRLRNQCVVTTQCALSSHTPAVAERLCAALRDVSRSIRGDSALA